ncbi:uncharacterized protein LOC113685740 [Pocillopora damicornis]|uniref:uncharacterized protein LOC113685740 n=1 Tax=Pocillopora damicornis TaxID=46731 RepID=UPI000F557D5F|nr:uncharacterized protein LOC113685740 [Pocillopora damicornis]
MANASGGSIDLASLMRTNKVEALHATASCGPTRFLVWTRLPEDSSTWILNATDGVNVWHSQLDLEQLDSHRELAEIDKYEAYFSMFRSGFQNSSISLAQLPNKVILTVGEGIPSLSYDLSEAKAIEKKTELQLILFKLADKVAELTQELKVSSDSLERLKTQKYGAPGELSTFDIPAKKTTQAVPVKRKQGRSLINPGSRKEAVVEAADGHNTEQNVHISVLGNDQTLDIYKCIDPACEHFCTKTNKRYHCPLCNNKPQKPGRMRRHFEKMHSGKQIVLHEGHQMLRCKLRCTKANGRITDNSHYHCCLCGRVLVRKVHLYCHLQAHSVGSMREIDELLDAKDDTEEGPMEDAEMDEDDDENHTALDTSQITTLEGSEQDSVVALSDGTQVVFVQSIQDSETLTVVPLDEPSDTLQLTQSVAQSDVTTVVSTAADLSTSLQVLTSVSSGLGNEQLQLPQELTVKQVNAMLSQGEETNQDASITTESSQGNLHNISGVNTDMSAYADQPTGDIDMEQSTETEPGLQKQSDEEAVEFEQCLQVTDVQMSQESSATGVSGMEQNNLQLSPVESSSASGQLITCTTTPGNVVQTSTSQSIADQGSSKLLMINPMNKSLFTDDSASASQNDQRGKTARQDTLVLVDATTAPKGDDHVFKVLLNNLSPATSCFCHPSVLNEKNNLDIRRCKNTYCDCRLYHCPLCTCLPNKPGRIREHFKKIHAQDLIVRYQGYQMLRCKLGCSRPSGTKVFNSHYHCCICGAICIRKSGVYEHMRVNHAMQPINKDTMSQQTQRAKCETMSAKPVVVQVPPVSTGPAGPVTQLIQTTQPQTPSSQGIFTGTGTSPQTVTVQIPQQGYVDGQAQAQVQGQQQVVILMPQQVNPNQVQLPSVPAQQPIVIVMPQAGGGQVTQPIVVPVPQPPST